MAIFKIINIIEFFVLLYYITVASCANLRCYDGTFQNFQELSLEKPTPLFNASCYNPLRKTVFYTHGFDGSATDQTTDRMVNVYLGKVNILCLNWEKEAAAILDVVSYPLVAIINVKKVGVRFGKALIKLANNGLSLANLHLIGFSLGAHVMGYAGETVKKDNKIVHMITCCDAAGPFFEGGISLPGVDASSAEFVLTIHTNPGKLGTHEAVGTVDLWPNCESPVQPGCTGNGIFVNSEQNRCSHDRSWQYLAESLLRPTAFLARSASNCDDWRAGKGTNDTIYLGDNINKQARGNYYLRTDSTSPYGLGEEGSQPAD